ncbi:MAG: hypothetical protein ACPG5W_09385 [Flavobacteriales bacterium]
MTLSQYATRSTSFENVARWWTVFIISAVGVIALLGWAIDYPIAYKYLAAAVSMKPITAFSSIIAAIVLTVKEPWKSKLGLVLLGIMGCLILQYASALFLTSPAPDATQNYTAFDNYPSWFTIVVFSLFIYCTQCSTCAVKGGRIILGIAIASGLGHATDCPLLYGYVEGLSTGLSAPTSLVALHLGAWMVKAVGRDEHVKD